MSALVTNPFPGPQPYRSTDRIASTGAHVAYGKGGT